MTGRLSCKRTALKRCASTEQCWNRKLVSLASPETWAILLPSSDMSWQVTGWRDENPQNLIHNWFKNIATFNFSISPPSVYPQSVLLQVRCPSYRPTDSFTALINSKQTKKILKMETLQKRYITRHRRTCLSEISGCRPLDQWSCHISVSETKPIQQNRIPKQSTWITHNSTIWQT